MPAIDARTSRSHVVTVGVPPRPSDSMFAA